ncbi:MAG: GspH/FimT family pseudopilin, partial [Deltaproteobacteria bacterium]|nr:GspH/FimT family pseudopilin [Deltaproteobacteria bacterium]
MNLLRIKDTESRIKEAGFTLTEMMVVVGLFVIMMAVGIPMFLSNLPNYRLRQAARQIAQDMNLAKMRAISTNQKHGIYFNPSGGGAVQNTQDNRYTLFRDDGGTQNQLDAGDYRVKDDWPLPDTITIQAANFVNDTVIFTPRSAAIGGTLANNRGTVVVGNQKGD